MGAWILILYLFDSSGAVAMTNIEFPTEEGCIEAGKTVETQFKPVPFRFIKYTCVEKK